MELVERKRIREAVRIPVGQVPNDERLADDAAEFVDAHFDGLKEEDRAVVVESIKDTLGALDEINSVAWDIPDEDAQRYADLRVSRRAANVPGYFPRRELRRHWRTGCVPPRLKLRRHALRASALTQT